MVCAGQLVVCLETLEFFDLAGNPRLCCEQSTVQNFLHAAIKEFGQGISWAPEVLALPGGLDLRGSVDQVLARASLPKKLGRFRLLLAES
eukprot:symbB.v1.2.034889.t1/scaffold4584.1/size37672/3